MNKRAARAAGKAKPAAAQAQAPVCRLRGISHRFEQGGRGLDVLNGVSLDLYPGEMVALLGPSGSGKSTLLHIAGLLEQPNDGEVEIEGRSTSGLSDPARTAIRRETIGFIYQFHHLLPEFSALENVVMPQAIAGIAKREARARARELLLELGLEERLRHKPSELSGGEQQRVAIARALANRPRLILADEPTGNLDPRTAEHVFDQILGLARRENVTALIATHNHELAQAMDRVLMLDENGLNQLT